jgi:hypothetical protein
MSSVANRRFAIGIGVAVAVFALINLLVFVAPPAISPYPVLAAMLGVVASVGVWGVTLSLITQRPSQAMGFAIATFAILLIPTPFRDAAFGEWLVFLAVTLVSSGAIIAKLSGPTRRQYAAQQHANPPHE